MAVDLNGIELTQWENNPNVNREIAKRIESSIWQQSAFEPLIGRSQDRAFRMIPLNGVNQAVTPRLKAALNGDGVKGNADFDTNYDSLEIHSLTMYPDNIANGLKSKTELEQKMEQVDFIKEAVDSLHDWMKVKIDRIIAVTLSNDFTNGVVCDEAEGYKDTTQEATLEDSTKKITKGDVLNVKAIKRAIFMAKRGLGYDGKDRFPIRPVAISYLDNKGIRTRVYEYVILVDTVGAEQLKNDPEWIELQKVDKKGLDNNLFTGFLGIIDSCPVIDMGTWSSTSTGLVHSGVSDAEFEKYLNIKNLNMGRVTPPSFYSGAQKTGIAVLMGASSLLFAAMPQPKIYIDKQQDLGRKIAVGIDRVMSIAKARWINHENPNSVYHNTDFATIGIFYSHEE
ncbi:DUF4043 family protein [Helicobacter sp. MIT 11-5569]|uniref:phage capsid family protein n=1 Tax=Helicobacter sp. MIT 11-5569 TaxID=1548151 RepID=UPI00051FEDC8|nr:DUF4043 family protein [Helicobacter sp. MIT 11-5569]TLD83948.1 DUF4043 family protein [Helicobacter sp. MIT 11-5569]